MQHRPRVALYAIITTLPLLSSLNGCRAQENLGSRPQEPTKSDSGAAPQANPIGLRVFITRDEFDGNLSVAGGAGSGLASADTLCQAAADAAGVDGQFISYLSSGGAHAFDRVVDEGPFYLLDLTTIAYPNKGAIGNGPAAELTSETGQSFTELRSDSTYWTGSLASGRASGRDCAQWTQADSSARGSQGATRGALDSDAYCFEKHHLLCVEQNARPEPAKAKKRVFVSSKKLYGAISTGKRTALEEVDAHCEAAAKDADLGGKWVGWLTGRDASGKLVRARDRITDATYAGMDGRVAFRSKTDLDGVPVTAIDMNEYGAKIARTPVWTGTLRGGAPATNNCNNWQQVTGVAGVQGIAGSTPEVGSWTGPEIEGGASDLVAPCSDQASIYCFEK